MKTSLARVQSELNLIDYKQSDFITTMGKILIDIKQIIDVGMASNAASIQSVYEGCNEAIKGYLIQLERDDLSLEERQELNKNVKEIVEMMIRKDSENKKHIRNIYIGVGGVIIATAGASAIYMAKK